MKFYSKKKSPSTFVRHAYWVCLPLNFVHTTLFPSHFSFCSCFIHSFYLWPNSLTQAHNICFTKMFIRSSLITTYYPTWVTANLSVQSVALRPSLLLKIFAGSTHVYLKMVTGRQVMCSSFFCLLPIIYSILIFFLPLQNYTHHRHNLSL